MSYEGCGCAGGEVTTFTDERGRSHRLIKDILGRLSKVEELNWDATVYAGTTYTYDELDHLKQINQGGRLRQFAYDGHGRLESRTTPEQGTTTYTYNLDDTLNTTTDARGVTATFTYTNRHLVKTIDYTVPAGVAETPDLTFSYDAPGHRTSMTETLSGQTVGTTTYDYNDLGQLASETRSFGGATPAPVTLSYMYNWGGQLIKLTSSLGPEVVYVRDQIGRVEKVTGAGYAGVGSYIDTVEYRAFGGVKSIGYGNSKSLSVTYDPRMRTKRWNVSGVLGWDYYYGYFGENSARVTFADSLNDAKSDRSFEYDHLGRLKYAYTGQSARAHVGLTQTWVGDGAYGTAYHYDQWGNMTEREGWIRDNPTNWEEVDSMAYVASLNGKNQLTKNPATGVTMLYDAAGNLKNDGTWALTYDATGQQTEGRSAGVVSLTQSYDGERLRVKKVENEETTYYVRSSVLGGQVVAELGTVNNQIKMKRGYVYLGGQLLAIQQENAVTWVHADPVTKSQRFTDSAGELLSQRIDLEPWGRETAKTVDPTIPGQKPTHRFTTYERDANGTDEAMHRRYNSVRSRFEQPDPWDGSYDLGDPQSFNRYSYVQNDPVNFIDPTGLDENLCPMGEDGVAHCNNLEEVSVSISFGDQSTSVLAFFNEVSGMGGLDDLIIPRRGEPRAIDRAEEERKMFDEAFDLAWKALTERDACNNYLSGSVADASYLLYKLGSEGKIRNEWEGGRSVGSSIARADGYGRKGSISLGRSFYWGDVGGMVGGAGDNDAVFNIKDVSPAVARAVTLLHEVGHLTSIVPRHRHPLVPGSNSASAAYDREIYANCFK